MSWDPSCGSLLAAQQDEGAEGEAGSPERQAAVSIHLSSCPVLSSPRWLVWQGSTSWLICTSVGLRAGEGLAMAPRASSRSPGSRARGGEVEPCWGTKAPFYPNGK